MGLTIAQKIIKAHLISGEMKVGEEIALRIDQTLTQDATGTMAYLEFEAIGIPRVKTELSVAYIDHNTLQSGFENAKSTVFASHVPETVYAIRYILSVSAFREKRLSGLTAIHLRVAVSVCLHSVPVDLTLRLQWAAVHTTSLCLRCTRSTSRVSFLPG